MRVMEWAKLNWEALEPQALEAHRKTHAAMQAMYNSMAIMPGNPLGELYP